MEFCQSTQLIVYTENQSINHVSVKRIELNDKTFVHKYLLKINSVKGRLQSYWV